MRKIIKQFYVIPFISVILICCAFIHLENNAENLSRIKYQENIERVTSKIVANEIYCTNYARQFLTDLVTVNNNIKKEYKLLKYQEQKRSEEEAKKNLEAQKLDYNINYYYNDTKYFTDEQQLRIPEGYTLDEIRMFCTMVYGECGAITGDVLITYYDENNNPEESFYIDASYMHKLTANVLYNRMKHESFPDTIYDNLVMKNQYTELYTYEFQSYEYYSGNGSNWCNVVDEVLEVLNEEFQIPDDVIFQSNFSNLGSRYYAKIHVDTGYFRSTSYYAYD